MPGIFAPEEIDGRMLVDGSVVQNLPVKTVRAMGVDRVIAVDLLPAEGDADAVSRLELHLRGHGIGEGLAEGRGQRDLGVELLGGGGHEPHVSVTVTPINDWNPSQNT